MRTLSMIVRIRLTPGPVLGAYPDKRAAARLGVICGQVAVIGYTMSMWKWGVDLGNTDQFTVDSGALPNWQVLHWQVWAGASLAANAIAVRLRRYSEQAPDPRPAQLRPTYRKRMERFPLSPVFQPRLEPQYRAG